VVDDDRVISGQLERFIALSASWLSILCWFLQLVAGVCRSQHDNVWNCFSATVPTKFMLIRYKRYVQDLWIDTNCTWNGVVPSSYTNAVTLHLSWKFITPCKNDGRHTRAKVNRKSLRTPNKRIMVSTSIFTMWLMMIESFRDNGNDSMHYLPPDWVNYSGFHNWWLECAGHSMTTFGIACRQPSRPSLCWDDTKGMCKIYG